MGGSESSFHEVNSVNMNEIHFVDDESSPSKDLLDHSYMS